MIAGTDGRGRLKQTKDTERSDERTAVGRQALRTLIENQGYKCALTGTPLTPETASADHVVPLASGGKHVIANIEIVRCDVNAAKGTMSRDDFVKMCCEVADWSRKPKK